MASSSIFVLPVELRLSIYDYLIADVDGSNPHKLPHRHWSPTSLSILQVPCLRQEALDHAVDKCPVRVMVKTPERFPNIPSTVTRVDLILFFIQRRPHPLQYSQAWRSDVEFLWALPRLRQIRIMPWDDPDNVLSMWRHWRKFEKCAARNPQKPVNVQLITSYLIEGARVYTKIREINQVEAKDDSPLTWYRPDDHAGRCTCRTPDSEHAGPRLCCGPPQSNRGANQDRN